MTTRRLLIRVSLLALLIGLGAIVGCETVEVDDGTGDWHRIGSRFVLPWQPSLAVSARPEVNQYLAVRVTRWYCYGLGFRHAEHYHRNADYFEQGEKTRREP